MLFSVIFSCLIYRLLTVRVGPPDSKAQALITKLNRLLYFI